MQSLELKFLNNTIVELTVGVVLLIIFAKAKPYESKTIKKLFKNPIYTLIYLSIFVYLAGKSSIRIGVMSSVFYLMTMYYMNKTEQEKNVELLKEINDLKSIESLD
jgi:hypothetical protein